jgi:hypothetical protein
MRGRQKRLGTAVLRARATAHAGGRSQESALGQDGPECPAAVRAGACCCSSGELLLLLEWQIGAACLACPGWLGGVGGVGVDVVHVAIEFGVLVTAWGAALI